MLKVLGRFSGKLIEISTKLPQTLYGQDRAFADISGRTDSFEKKAVCSKCHSLYSFVECVQGGTINTCSYRFNQRYRSCGTPLMKKVVSCSGNVKYYPHSVYCYSHLISGLQAFMVRPGFVEQCESTRNSFHATELHDVYDGII